MPKILIIEDNQPELDLMCYLLKRFGYEPEVAFSGEEALEIAIKDPPDLVLCDLRLPQMDGYEVTHRLRQEPLMRGKSIVAVSGALRTGDEERMRAEGFDGQILKPLVAEQFAKQIEHFLASDRPHSLEETGAAATAKSLCGHGQDSYR